MIVLAYLCFVPKKRKKSRGMFSGNRDVAPSGSKDDPFGGEHHHYQHSVPLATKNVVVVQQTLTPPGILSNYPASADGSNSCPPPSAGSCLNSERPLSSFHRLAFAKTSFTYHELQSATCNFADNNLLGEGGFGYVHKGVLPDGKEVAIKQLKEGSSQGESEFLAEVEIISRVDHEHLVSLEGCCCSGAKRLLVYLYVPNKTLEFHLHGKGQPTMNWATRMKIALGTAKALTYLHDDCRPKIIHRDIKAANILLDDNFEAKVADFGLAKLYDDDDDDDTHVSTRVMGTFGYLAPEYAQSGKLNDKADVFSFGVVLLELITGRRPISKKEKDLDYDNIVDWARPLLRQALEDGNFDTVADPRLRRNYKHAEMHRMIACASVCVRISARLRPKMSQILFALLGKISLGELKQGVTPGDSRIYGHCGSLDDYVSRYSENLKIFHKMVQEDKENNASECNGPISDSGVQPSASSSEGLRNTQEIRSRYKAQNSGKKEPKKMCCC